MFAPAQGACVAGRFDLVREIGRGGMGAVWECVDRELHAPCALKFILDDFASHPELRARFLREARAVAQLQSPHAVSVWSVGEWEGCLYIAMELLRGESLQQRLEREGKLDASATSALVEQVSEVLQRAHAMGIVHRDLKPDNIWLWEGAKLFVKVLDFGVAKHTTSVTGPQTATGAMVGTPYYMSPEQAAGNKNVDHRSDLWSLAVIAVECLGGKRPFDSSGLGDLLLQIIERPIPTLADLNIEASGDLQAWWESATSRELERRFQSAGAVSTAFTQAVHNKVDSVRVSASLPAAAAVNSARGPAPEPNAGTVQPLAHTQGHGPKPQSKSSLLWLAAGLLVVVGAALVLWRQTQSMEPESPVVAAEPVAESHASASTAPHSSDSKSPEPEASAAAPADRRPAVPESGRAEPEPPPVETREPRQEVKAPPPSASTPRKPAPPKVSRPTPRPAPAPAPPKVSRPVPIPKPKPVVQPPSARDRVGF